MIRLSKKDRELAPGAMVTYRKPRSLWTHLTNFKTICHTGPLEEQQQRPGESGPCGKCGLCGSRRPFLGQCSVFPVQNSVQNESGKIVKLKKSLSCKNYGIYGIRCLHCPTPTWYVGQTKNPFSTRFAGHRRTWKSAENLEIDKVDDKAALVKHYARFHADMFNAALEFHEAWTVVFLDCPANPAELDLYENRWLDNLKASVNIQKMVLPTHK